MDKPCQIINRNLETIPTSSAIVLPNKNAWKQIIKRARGKYKPKEPQSLSDIDIPDDLKTLDGELFLVSDTIFDETGRDLIFCTKNNIDLLKNSLIWLMDGTFQCCPLLFAQLYSVHGLIGSGANAKVVPLVYALLTHKTQECYTHFFQELKRYADSILRY